MSDPEGLIQPSKTMFDSKALNGLRGLMAFHIVLYHGFEYSLPKFGIYAEVRFALRN